MPRRRFALSAHSDSSEMDPDSAGSEMAKLQRQFRIMEGDQQAYNLQAREQIRKQQQEMEKLLKEQEEQHRNLSVCKSIPCQQQDNEDIQSLCVLLEQKDMLEEALTKEKRCQKEIEKKIAKMQLKQAELRKGQVGASDVQRSDEQRTQKTIRTLEYKLDRALTHFNEQLTKNSRLRQELQTLHIERVHFQQLQKRLEKELQDIHKKIAELVHLSTAAYDARTEGQSKMTMMREKAVKDLAQYNAEMKELDRVIAHECNLKEFMTTKCSERSGQDAGHETGPKQLSELTEQRRMDLGDDSLDSPQELFKMIQTMTGEDNLDVLATRSIQLEDQNFALFNFVNEQNNEVEKLRDQISQVKADIEQFREMSLQQEEDHRSLLRDTDEQQKKSTRQAEDYETQTSIISRILDEVKIGVNGIFSKLECGRSLMEGALGSSTGMNETNIMSYLALVEQKTDELLTVQAFFSSKDPEKDYNLKDLPRSLLGQNPEQLQQNINIQTAIKNVDHGAEDFPVTNEEERPLSKEELRRRITNAVLRRESSATNKSSKIHQQSAGRRHSAEDALI
ncbi:coiled-coil domain-containing protein 114 [Brachionichthys hirsutus]|uniref:coiled-coil domain-containing protein 114 n=1 Tax=Brachionichthys hirsutus TaxID=412623 RepID=UPI003604A389